MSEDARGLKHQPLRHLAPWIPLPFWRTPVFKAAWLRSVLCVALDSHVHLAVWQLGFAERKVALA